MPAVDSIVYETMVNVKDGQIMMWVCIALVLALILIWLFVKYHQLRDENLKLKATLYHENPFKYYKFKTRR